MFAIITNTHTNESKFINLLEWCSGLNPNQITLEKAADKIIKRISATYPKAYKHIFNHENHISIMAGNVVKCIFEICAVEELKDYDDSFFC